MGREQKGGGERRREHSEYIWARVRAVFAERGSIQRSRCDRVGYERKFDLISNKNNFELLHLVTLDACKGGHKG